MNQVCFIEFILIHLSKNNSDLASLPANSQRRHVRPETCVARETEDPEEVG